MNCRTGEFTQDKKTIEQWINDGDRLLLFDVQEQAGLYAATDVQPKIEVLPELGAKIVNLQEELRTAQRQRSTSFVQRVEASLSRR